MKRMVTIPGTADSIVRPIGLSISNDLLKILQIENKNVITNFSDNPILMEHNSGASTLDKTLNSEVLEITMKEEAIQDLELTRVPIHPDSIPFFFDPETHTKATVAYRSIKLNFDLKLHSKSRSFINNVIDLLHVYKIEGAMHNLHNLQLLINIPNVTSDFIQEVFEIKKSYDNTLVLSDFLKDTLNKNCIDQMLSLDGNQSKSRVVVKEYQNDALGYFLGEFTEIEKDKEGIYHTLSLNYIVQYQKPVSVHMEFPYLIYNKRLSEKFIKTPVDYVKRNFRNHEKELMLFLDKNPSFGINKMGYYITYPRDDDFDIRDKMFGYCPILSLLCQVDKDHPKDLFNILNLGTIEFIDSVKEFLILQKDYVTTYMQSLFYFALYEDDCIKGNLLSMDELGNLTSLIDLNYKCTYRVVIFICCDISLIPMPNRKTIIDFLNSDLLKNKGQFLNSYLSFFNVDKSKIWDIYQSLTDKSPGSLLLKLRLAEYEWPKYNATHHTEVYRLLKE